MVLRDSAMGPRTAVSWRAIMSSRPAAGRLGYVRVSIGLGSALTIRMACSKELLGGPDSMAGGKEGLGSSVASTGDMVGSRELGGPHWVGFEANVFGGPC